jgi:hypothetical protein
MKRLIAKLSGVLLVVGMAAPLAQADVPIQGPEMPMVRRLANDIYTTANNILWEIDRGVSLPRRYNRGALRQFVYEVQVIRDEALRYQASAHSAGFAHQAAGSYFSLERAVEHHFDRFFFREPSSIRLSQLYRDLATQVTNLSSFYAKVKTTGDWKTFDNLVDNMEDYTDRLEKLGSQLNKQLKTASSEFAEERLEDLEDALDRLDSEIDTFGAGSPTYVMFLYADVRAKIQAVVGMQNTHKDLFTNEQVVREIQTATARFAELHEGFLRAIDGAAE